LLFSFISTVRPIANIGDVKRSTIARSFVTSYNSKHSQGTSQHWKFRYHVVMRTCTMRCCQQPITLHIQTFHNRPHLQTRRQYLVWHGNPTQRLPFYEQIQWTNLLLERKIKDTDYTISFPMKLSRILQSVRIGAHWPRLILVNDATNSAFFRLNSSYIHRVTEQLQSHKRRSRIKRQNICSSRWRPIGLYDVEAVNLMHRPPFIPMVLISARG
jgi:hypothetical protein